MDKDNGHRDNGNEDNPPIAVLLSQAMEEARTGNKEERSNGSFSAIEEKQLGVLPFILRTIQKTSEYRQELKTANWPERYDAQKAVAAIHERILCGVPIDPIIDRIIAESAGINSGRLELVIRGLTHTTFNTNQASMGKQHFWNRNRGDKEPSSSRDILQ